MIIFYMYVIRRLNLIFRKKISVAKSAMENHRLLCASYSTEPARDYIVLKGDANKIFITENFTNFRTYLVKELAELKFNHDINARVCWIMVFNATFNDI